VARTVTWSEPAWHDLEQVADYIAQDSLHYAATFVREVRDAARSLVTFAERGRIVPEYNDPAVREREHVGMIRDNPDGTRTPQTMPNHPKIKGSTLRTICTKAGIRRDDFLAAYDKT
jgi:plasmid stabilization system protein ParE